MNFQHIVLALLLHTIASDPVVYNINPFEASSCPHDSLCLTLKQFVANIHQHLRYQTILNLNNGTHSFSSGQINVKDINLFTITSETISIINCSQDAGFKFNKVKMISLTNIKFIGCGGSIGVIRLTDSSANISSCHFIYSKGKVIVAENSKVIILHSLLKSSYARFITAQSTSKILVNNTIFESNANETVLYSTKSTSIFQKCIFHNNSDLNLIHVCRKSTTELENCELSNNNAKSGSLIKSDSHAELRINNTHFKLNSLKRGRLLLAENINLTINNCTFTNNTVEKLGLLHVWYSKVEVYTDLDIRGNIVEWGVLYIHRSELTIHQNVKFTNNHAIQSTVSIYQSIVNFSGILEFSHNIGAILIKESKVTFNNASTFAYNEQQNPNTSIQLGGAITSMWSMIHFYGTAKFYRNNAWKIGGAIIANRSRVYAQSIAIYKGNTAGKGGALYLDHSYFTCQSNCTFIDNKASTKGGAVHAIDSIISIGNEWFTFQDTSHLPRVLSFVNNHAEEGGGISLETNSKVHGPLKSSYEYFIQFINNTADKGAAIYVNDYGTCSNVKYLNCFLFTPYKELSWVIFNVTESENAIYGGLLDRCNVETGHITDPFSTDTKKGIEYIKNISNDSTTDMMISSDPVKLCYCLHGKMDCKYKHPPVKTEKGKAFHVLITAIDQADHQVNATVQIHHPLSTGIRLEDQQYTQKIPNNCSNISLSVYSSHQDSAMLALSADGPCNSTDIIKMKVIFLNCTCPIGFQEVIGESDNCKCDCDPYIQCYITKCNESTKSLIRQGNFWISYYDSISDNPYIIYHNCPYDYCVLSTKEVSINLNDSDGADAQCAFNRTGLLCSGCKSPFNTLSLGSSRCLACTKNWPSTFIVTLIVGGLCGIALVAVILVLNLTVAVGTLNGLVFYANIVASNNIIYYRTGSEPNAVLSVFIAWLNLETGVNLDVCVIKGLDTNSKMWMQFLFPTYLIFVLLALVAISRCSSRFAILIGKRNPIATLATLILLSYMKFLRNIIDILSFAVIHYPDGSHKVHWLPDAEILYLHGRHIPLFLIAVLIILVGLSYIILLFSWQWLLQASKYRLLRWVRNTRLNSFMEANVAAYTPKHRYWTGLLLFIRVILYLVIAYNTKEPRASFLAIALIVASLLLLMVVVGGNIYRKKFIGFLNSLCYVNLLMLSIAQLYWQNNIEGQRISAEISVDAAFALLLGILIYHTIKALLEISCLSQLKTLIVQRIVKMGKTRLLTGHQETNMVLQTMPSQAGPTFTEVGLSDSREACTNEYGKEHDILDNSPRITTRKWEGRDSLHEPLLDEKN